MRLSSGVDIICRSIRELGGPVHVHGAPASAQAHLIASLCRDPEVSWVVLCPDDEAAASLASDIEALSLTVHGSELSVLQFPTWDQSPYSSIAPSIKTRLARMNVLSALVNGPAPRIVITSLPACYQATLPKDVFSQHSITVRAGGSVESREALILRLLECGYLRVDPVEDPGTFAVRGDIIDVFPPDRERPLRIELFGDEVERMREFDPATQRAAGPDSSTLKEVILPPAREVLINSKTTATVRERVKERADDAGIPRPVRDPILASVHSGTYPDHCDTWAGFAYERPGTLKDYLPSSFQLAWVDELSSQQNWDTFLQEQKALEGEATTSGTIVPPLNRVYLIDDEVRKRCALFLDRLEVLDASNSPEAEQEELPAVEGQPNQPTVSQRHQVRARNNADLTQGTRHSLGDLEAKFRLWAKQGFRVLALASTESQLERIRFLLEERQLACIREVVPQPGHITLSLGSLSEGFRWPAEGLVVLTEGEILGTRHVRKARRASKSESGSAAKDWSGLQALSDLAVGDAIVHVDHGIGRYQGLTRLDLNGAPSDFLQIEYANKDKLYLPVYRLNVIQKYVGAGEAVVLDKLGSQHFAKEKEKVKEAVKKLAVDLVQLYAERKVRPGMTFNPPDGLFREFEARFPFDETPDQLKAIEQVMDDLESGRAMDRLVCGDVGYGKTEVAIRAAFRAVSEGKQVVVLVPTTVLAFQHEQSFRARLKDYPMTVESVSRFKSAKEQKAILERLAEGKVDVIIGTHRLLSKDVQFKDLGLIVVDEEHRFGVEHKEKLKTIRVNTHVLTLTATPIPRTLHMALSGLRDISLINTAPVNRLPIRTYVSRFDESLIQRAVSFELNRGGQVFFLHNRVQSIHEIANKIRALVPEARVGVGHGQMGEKELEETMMSFYQKRINVLVSTTIIESGLDVPSANTILINRADTLGLAQLYQIRGRVGRGQQRAYAYLLIPAEGALTEDARRRLEVIQRFVELGSGFSVASHDLEIRGGGDLLGPQQSGHIAAVGFDLYTELLEEAIRELKNKGADQAEPVSKSREPEIKAPFPAYLGEEYVPDIHQRLALYRRFSAAADDSEIDRMEEELRDRFGALPPEAQNLLWLIRVKLLLKKARVDTLTVGPEKVSMVIGADSPIDPSVTIALVAGNRHDYQLTPDSKLVSRMPTGTLRDLFFALEGLFKKLIPAEKKAR